MKIRFSKDEWSEDRAVAGIYCMPYVLKNLAIHLFLYDFDMSLLVSTELRYIKRESPVWIATLNIDMLLKSRAGKSRS